MLHRPAHRLGPGVSKNPLGGRIPFLDQPVGINEKDGIKRGVQDGGLAGFALAQGLLRSLALGEIVDDDLHTRLFLKDHRRG